MTLPESYFCKADVFFIFIKALLFYKCVIIIELLFKRFFVLYGTCLSFVRHLGA